MTEPRQADRANAGQIDYWNAAGGAKWVSFQEILDTGFAAAQARLLARAAAQDGERVLDIGCGAGATTVELAARVGPRGRVLGVDVARPLLDRAIARAARAGLGNVDYLLADGQTHGFESGAFDLMVSRFGVMFFADPIAAFGNIAAALRPGGRIAFVSWAGLRDNPWFRVPRDAAIARLGAPEAVPANAPGPMAFQDTAYVSDILARAGLSEVSAAVEEVRLALPGSLAEAAELATNLGPASRIVTEKDGTPEDVAAIARDIAQGLGGYLIDGAVSVPATLNFYTAARR